MGLYRLCRWESVGYLWPYFHFPLNGQVDKYADSYTRVPGSIRGLKFGHLNSSVISMSWRDFVILRFVLYRGPTVWSNVSRKGWFNTFNIFKRLQRVDFSPLSPPKVYMNNVDYSALIGPAWNASKVVHEIKIFMLHKKCTAGVNPLPPSLRLVDWWKCWNNEPALKLRSMLYHNPKIVVVLAHKFILWRT